MKKIIFIFIILNLLILSLSCDSEKNENNKYNKTIAICFEERKIGDNIFSISYSSKRDLENLLIYEDENMQAYYITSAPLEKESFSTIKGNDNYIINGRYTSINLPQSLNNESSISCKTGENIIKVFPSDDKEYIGELIEYNNIFNKKDQAIVYSDMFGKDVDFFCMPTSFGINSEIVLKNKPETNIFSIKISLPKTYNYIISPDYISFKDNENVKSLVYTPIAIDKKGTWEYNNQIKITEENADNGTYIIQYEINSEFLKNASYPVILNQSIYNYKSKQPDTSVYENVDSNDEHYLSPYIILGDNTYKGEGWAYIRYETLADLNIDSENIISAKYIFRNLFDLQEEAIIGLYPVTVDWCSINTRWDSRPLNNENPIDFIKIKKAGDYEVDITEYLKEMIKNKNKNEPYSIENGFLIKSESKDSKIILASGDNGLFSPCLEIILYKGG